MGRLVRDSRLETREARRKLGARKEPYWRLIVEGIHLGYYKGSIGGTWYVRGRLPAGKYLWRSIALADDVIDANGTSILSFSQAQAKAKDIAHQLIHGDSLTDTPYTVQHAIDDYLADFKASGKKSLYATETQIKAHIRPHFADRVVASLTFPELNKWKNTLATTSKRTRTGLGCTQQFQADENQDEPEYQRKRRATANRIITIFKAILNHAFKTDRVQSNEAWHKLKPFKNVSAPKIRFLLEDECLRLLNACEADLRILVRAALLTGARYGELAALKVNDYTDKKTIFISQSKSGKPRHIPLNDEGSRFFDQLTVGKLSQEIIFTRTNGSPWKKNYQIRPLATACTQANIIPSINFHDLRHTYASTLAMRGVPLQVIAAVLGHSDTRITHKHYAHLMPSYIARVIQEHLPNFGETEKNNIIKLPKQRATS